MTSKKKIRKLKKNNSQYFRFTPSRVRKRGSNTSMIYERVQSGEKPNTHWIWMRIIFHIDPIATGNQLQRIMIMTMAANEWKKTRGMRKSSSKFASIQNLLEQKQTHNSFGIFQFPLFMEIYGCWDKIMRMMMIIMMLVMGMKLTKQKKCVCVSWKLTYHNSNSSKNSHNGSRRWIEHMQKKTKLEEEEAEKQQEEKKFIWNQEIANATKEISNNDK